YEGLGSYSRKITTDSPEAQRYFDQGLAFLHGFNHRAATRAFQQAGEIDPRCAMAHWGVALACGPHINFTVVPPPAAELAWKELNLARKNAMREVWRKFPKDPDAGALFAEAMMDLRPWDQWTPEGKPQPGTD